MSIGRAHVASLHLFPTNISKWLLRSFDACLSPASWVCPASRQYNCATIFCCVTNHFTAIRIKRAPLVQRNPTLAVLLFRSLAFSVRIDNLSRACALLGGHLFSVVLHGQASDDLKLNAIRPSHLGIPASSVANITGRFTPLRAYCRLISNP